MIGKQHIISVILLVASSCQKVQSETTCVSVDERNETGFRKFNFTSGSERDIGFPLNVSSANYLRENSNSISVMLPEEGCTMDTDFQEIKNKLIEKGLYPPSQPDETDFWKQFEEVVDVQALRKKKERYPRMKDPLHKIMPFCSLPQIWRGFDILEVAEAVHDEFPGIYHIEMITNWLNQGRITPNNKVIPKFGKIDFLRGPVLLSDMVGLAIRLVGTCNFALKWEVGRARPEEIAWKIKEGELKVPTSYQRVSNIIEDMDLDSATRFTAYAEGSPTHPSWPAMHSAASAASFWLNVIVDLTEEQLCEARKLDYVIAYGRTVAGVHYPDDNIAGLMVGQEILAQRLPTYLELVYGSDKEVLEQKIQNAIYDWTVFKESDCYKGIEPSSMPCKNTKSGKYGLLSKLFGRNS